MKGGGIVENEAREWKERRPREEKSIDNKIGDSREDEKMIQEIKNEDGKNLKKNPGR